MPRKKIIYWYLLNNQEQKAAIVLNLLGGFLLVKMRMSIVAKERATNYCLLPFTVFKNIQCV